MTAAEEMAEWHYRREERLGILTDGRRDPWTMELATATCEADEAVEELLKPTLKL